MGRNLFDYAFKEYARRWAFKHPTPADLFRTMEDASGEDLDWYWRGWFYNTDPCDISLDTVKWAVLDTNAPNAPQSRGGGGGRGGRGGGFPSGVAKPILNDFDDISKIRNREDKNIVFATDADKALRDFYWNYDRGLVKVDTTTSETRMPQPAAVDTFTEAERFAVAGTKNMYELTFSNKGGLVMPIIIEWTYKDGTKEIERIPVQIWRKNEYKVVKAFMKDKEVVSIKIDPMRETADINEANNVWPAVTTPSKFQLFKTGGFGRGPRGAAAGGSNPMQKEIKQ
jgi:hypothetical protein